MENGWKQPRPNMQGCLCLWKIFMFCVRSLPSLFINWQTSLTAASTFCLSWNKCSLICMFLYISLLVRCCRSKRCTNSEWLNQQLLPASHIHSGPTNLNIQGPLWLQLEVDRIFGEDVQYETKLMKFSVPCCFWLFWSFTLLKIRKAVHFRFHRLVVMPFKFLWWNYV